MFKRKEDHETLILGAGPAGLACAYELTRHKSRVTLIEKEAQVGGLCRTIKREGNYFDIGGHRFFSKSAEINALWKEILKDDLLIVKRKSRIYFKRKYFDYPLKLTNVLFNLGLWNSLLCLLSYFRALLNKRQKEYSFEKWVTNRFGKRLYKIFFKTYTEKVWGIDCSNLSSDWATQRIRGMSLKRAVVDTFFKSGEVKAKSLINQFIYPLYGPGMFCDKLCEETKKMGAEYLLSTKVVAVYHQNNRIEEVLLVEPDGTKTNRKINDLVSSIPITVLIRQFKPAPPEDVMKAAFDLKFRSFVVVNVVLNRESVFDDNWIYVHDERVQLARIQNYKNWSHYMIRDTKTTTLGLEYFADEGDRVWCMPEQEMIHFAMEELEKISIAKKNEMMSGFVIRVAKVYPVYDDTYQKNLNIVRDYLDAFSNLSVIGRCGKFRYDNSDHALLSGLYAARNIHGSNYNIWDINTDEEYHEEFGPYNKELAGKC